MKKWLWEARMSEAEVLGWSRNYSGYISSHQSITSMKIANSYGLSLKTWLWYSVVPHHPDFVFLHKKKMRELSLFWTQWKVTWGDFCWTVETSPDCTVIIPSLRIIESNFHDGAEMKLTSVSPRLSPEESSGSEGTTRWWVTLNVHSTPFARRFNSLMVLLSSH